MPSLVLDDISEAAEDMLGSVAVCNREGVEVAAEVADNDDFTVLMDEMLAFWAAFLLSFRFVGFAGESAGRG